jgi:hypothetical protein
MLVPALMPFEGAMKLDKDAVPAGRDQEVVKSEREGEVYLRIELRPHTKRLLHLRLDFLKPASLNWRWWIGGLGLFIDGSDGL